MADSTYPAIDVIVGALLCKKLACENHWNAASNLINSMQDSWKSVSLSVAPAKLFSLPEKHGTVTTQRLPGFQITKKFSVDNTNDFQPI